jgi:hypothetical protein
MMANWGKLLGGGNVSGFGLYTLPAHVFCNNICGYEKQFKQQVEAVENLATTITEIIESKIRVIMEEAKAAESAHGGINKPAPVEGWVARRRRRNI